MSVVGIVSSMNRSAFSTTLVLSVASMSPRMAGCFRLTRYRISPSRVFTWSHANDELLGVPSDHHLAAVPVDLLRLTTCGGGDPPQVERPAVRVPGPMPSSRRPATRGRATRESRSGCGRAWRVPPWRSRGRASRPGPGGACRDRGRSPAAGSIRAPLRRGPAPRR